MNKFAFIIALIPLATSAVLPSLGYSDKELLPPINYLYPTYARQTPSGDWATTVTVGFYRRPWISNEFVKRQIERFVDPTPIQRENMGRRLSQCWAVGLRNFHPPAISIKKTESTDQQIFEFEKPVVTSDTGIATMNLTFAAAKNDVKTGVMDFTFQIPANLFRGWWPLRLLWNKEKSSDVFTGGDKINALVSVGKIHFVANEGVSIISDIDDTIKETGVLLRRALLSNTFLNTAKAIDMTASIFQTYLTRYPSVSFHYVSNSPVQLYPFLEEFLRNGSFPGGSMHLREIPFGGVSVLKLLRGVEPTEHKMTTISRILREFPKREVVLIGDSTEKDPEVYAELYSRFPGRVKCILIRVVEGFNPEKEEILNSKERFDEAFKNVDGVRYRLWKDAREIANGCGN